MKKIYYIDCNGEFNSDIYGAINEKVDGYYGKTKREAVECLKQATKYVKERFADWLKTEKKEGNTITLDLYVAKVDDNEDYKNWNIFQYDYQLVDSRYLCGRY